MKHLLWPISLWKSNKAGSRSWKEICPDERVFDDEGEVVMRVEILMKHSTRGEGYPSAWIWAGFVLGPPHQCSQQLSCVPTYLQSLSHSYYFRDFSSPFNRENHTKFHHKVLKYKVKWPPVSGLVSRKQVLQGCKGKTPKLWAKLEHWSCTQEVIQWLLENSLSWSLTRMIAC